MPDHRLDDPVVAREAAIGSVLAEAGDPAVHQLRKALPQHLGVAETPALHRAGLVVLDQHVGALEQPQQHLLALLRRQVEAERALRSEEHTSELPSLMRNTYAVFCF